MLGLRAAAACSIVVVRVSGCLVLGAVAAVVAVDGVPGPPDQLQVGGVRAGHTGKAPGPGPSTYKGHVRITSPGDRALAAVATPSLTIVLLIIFNVLCNSGFNFGFFVCDAAP